MSRTTSEYIEAFGAAYLRLTKLVADVGDSQWQAGSTAVPREDTTERSLGMVSDPTPSIVADRRRIELRADVLRAEAVLLSAIDAMTAAERHLTTSLTKWQG